MVRRRTQKRHQQGGEGDGNDRISELPEPLICRILSLLDDMKDVVKSSILSKKWRYHWIHVDRIIYSFDLSRKKNWEKNWENYLESFIYSFVDRTLMKCISPKIKKFSISGFGFDTNRSPPINEMVPNYIVDKWIEYVISKNVEDLKLGLKGLDYVAPACLYSNSCLEKLEIDRVGNYDTSATCYSERCPLYHLDEFGQYRGDMSIDLRVLKSLSLKGIYLPDTFMENIILGCPRLETMVLEKVRGLQVLNITSQTMTELKLLSTRVWEIIAPWVKKLEISGSSNFSCQLVSVGSLEYANLTLNFSAYLTDEYYDPKLWVPTMKNLLEPVYHVNELVPMVKNLLEPVYHVNELTIGAELLQALSLSQMTTKRLFQSCTCKYLMILSPMCVHEVPAIVCLLESSPNLETLVIEVARQCHLTTDREIRKVFFSFCGVDYLSQREKNFPCLKNVEINCTEKIYSQDKLPISHDRSGCMSFELEIASHIIRNAPVLEKLVIVSKSNSYDSRARYVPLLSSEDKVGEKAARWELKKTKSAYEFSFGRNKKEVQFQSTRNLRNRNRN